MKKLTIVGLVALLLVAALTAGCVDKVTGGGWFTSNPDTINAGDHVNIGFNVKYNEDKEKKTLKGSLELKDHETGVRVHIEEMTNTMQFPFIGYVFTGSDTDGNTVYVLVDDAGEPGASEGDRITVWTTYVPVTGFHVNQADWAGTIEGGNIQEHTSE